VNYFKGNGAFYRFSDGFWIFFLKDTKITHFLRKNRGQMTDDGGQMTENRRLTTEDGRWKMEEGRVMTEDRRRITEDGRQTMDESLIFYFFSSDFTFLVYSIAAARRDMQRIIDDSLSLIRFESCSGFVGLSINYF
jgi:hypothetical protein